ncbi:hypothetical protein FZC78_15795 [Rossellomorea vietnamensis]|uniref:Uncharacterized protein n=1 Tax=Rossellomorea vietnamensis TaxID=218284 RepID=A0A5D4NPI5_9BACI|nr:hypothetical protein [Rossellomorea vietnamensis]TYS15461.1 hypothetical protein FZC78_15795 [Rossellomorea vietnamensis]
MNWKLLEGEGYSTFEWNGKAKIIGKKEFDHLEALLNHTEKKRVTVAVPAGLGCSEKKLKYLGFNKCKGKGSLLQEFGGCRRWGVRFNSYNYRRARS